MADLKSISKFLHDSVEKIKSPYYYVPPCPQCGSRATGRFIKSRGGRQDEWTVMESLKHGELVSPEAEIDSRFTTYCATCGFMWNGKVEIKWLSPSELEDEKIARGTRDIMNFRFQQDAENPDNVKKKKHSGFSSFLDDF